MMFTTAINNKRECRIQKKQHTFIDVSKQINWKQNIDRNIVVLKQRLCFSSDGYNISKMKFRLVVQDEFHTQRTLKKRLSCSGDVTLIAHNKQPVAVPSEQQLNGTLSIISNFNCAYHHIVHTCNPIPVPHFSSIIFQYYFRHDYSCNIVHLTSNYSQSLNRSILGLNILHNLLTLRRIVPVLCVKTCVCFITPKLKEEIIWSQIIWIIVQYNHFFIWNNHQSKQIHKVWLIVWFLLITVKWTALQLCSCQVYKPFKFCRDMSMSGYKIASRKRRVSSIASDTVFLQGLNDDHQSYQIITP